MRREREIEGGQDAEAGEDEEHEPRRTGSLALTGERRRRNEHHDEVEDGEERLVACAGGTRGPRDRDRLVAGEAEERCAGGDDEPRRSEEGAGGSGDREDESCEDGEREPVRGGDRSLLAPGDDRRSERREPERYERSLCSDAGNDGDASRSCYRCVRERLPGNFDMGVAWSEMIRSRFTGRVYAQTLTERERVCGE